MNKVYKMVHVRFDPSSTSYQSNQVGYGLGELSYFNSLPPYQRGFGYQKGAGLGDIFKGIWRFLLPVIKSPAVKELGQTLGKEAISSSANILNRVVQGEPIKSAALEEGKSAAETLLEKGIEKIKQTRQKGSGLPIKRKKKRSVIIPSHTTVIPPKSLKKRKRSDAFGFY